MTFPECWPAEAGEAPVTKSLDTPFNWRRPTDSLAPLNSGVLPANNPAKRGPKTLGGIGANGGTMTHLTTKQAQMLAPRVLRHAGPITPFRPGGNDAL